MIQGNFLRYLMCSVLDEVIAGIVSKDANLHTSPLCSVDGCATHGPQYTGLLGIYSIVLYMKTSENHEVPIFGILPTINSKQTRQRHHFSNAKKQKNMALQLRNVG